MSGLLRTLAAAFQSIAELDWSLGHVLGCLSGRLNVVCLERVLFARHSE